MLALCSWTLIFLPSQFLKYWGFDFLTYFSGERPFICELCGNSYTDIKNLKKHKTKVHSGKCLCFLKIWSSHICAIP